MIHDRPLNAVDLQLPEVVKGIVEDEKWASLPRGHRRVPLHVLALAVEVCEVALGALVDGNKGAGMGVSNHGALGGSDDD